MSIRTNLVGLVACLIAGFVTIGVSKGQAPTPVSPAAENAPRYWYYDFKKASPRGEKNLAGSLRQAADAVHNAKGEDEASAAKKKLTALIDKFFDEDMKQREQDLAELEKRLTKLREQLDRRRTKKQDIVDLQLKVVLNEADGLGFFSGNSQKGDLDLNLQGPLSSLEGLPVIAKPVKVPPPADVPIRPVEPQPAPEKEPRTVR